MQLSASLTTATLLAFASLCAAKCSGEIKKDEDASCRKGINMFCSSDTPKGSGRSSRKASALAAGRERGSALESTGGPGGWGGWENRWLAVHALSTWSSQHSTAQATRDAPDSSMRGRNEKSRLSPPEPQEASPRPLILGVGTYASTSHARGHPLGTVSSGLARPEMATDDVVVTAA
ncbi:unnamed protein product [Diplocarpon coronariae]